MTESPASARERRHVRWLADQTQRAIEECLDAVKGLPERYALIALNDALVTKLGKRPTRLCSSVYTKDHTPAAP